MPGAHAETDLARLKSARVLVTGAAGFIGFSVVQALAAGGVHVIGIDNMAELYYSRALKRMRLEQLQTWPGVRFIEADLVDGEAMAVAFSAARPTHVLHLAAHAAVLPSFDDPLAYVTSNVIGTQVVLEQARRCEHLVHLVYASTSSVYGRSVDGGTFHEGLKTDRPISVYGASKVANEAMMQVYADRYGLAVTGLRFFKVYGPWGRPDTVLLKFVDRVHHGLPIALHNFGEISHAFTYIDDVVAGTSAALARPGERSDAAHPIYNLGNPKTVSLERCLELIEAALDRHADRHLVPLPPGDRSFSRCDIGRAAQHLDYAVTVPIETGISRLVAWYLDVWAPLGRPFDAA